MVAILASLRVGYPSHALVVVIVKFDEKSARVLSFSIVFNAAQPLVLCRFRTFVEAPYFINDSLFHLQPLTP